MIVKGTIIDDNILPKSKTVDVCFRAFPYKSNERVTVQVSDIVTPAVTTATVDRVLKKGSEVCAKFSVSSMDKESTTYPLGLRCRHRTDPIWIYLQDISLPPANQEAK